MKNKEDMMLYDADKVSKVGKKIAWYVYIIIIIVVLAGCFYVITQIGPVDSKDSEKITFVVEKNSATNTVIKNLEEKDLIKNAFVLKIFLKLSKDYDVYAGTYELSKDMSAFEIMEKLTDNTSAIQETLDVMFVEGKRVPYYVKKISENFGYSEEEIYDEISNRDYLKELIDKYWFLTDEILDQEIYYPLEGYLWPAKYSFYKDASIKDIIEVLLDQTESKLSTYRDDITLSGKTVHTLLTMASMVELEAVTPEDRAGVAGVFYNRLNTGMTLGSDVTTYYAAKKEMTESLYKSELNDCNAYNTRGTCVKGLPIGPICSPSESSIVAAISPTESKYIYFVADKNRKVYFNETYNGHNATINDLKNKKLWA